MSTLDVVFSGSTLGEIRDHLDRVCERLNNSIEVPISAEEMERIKTYTSLLNDLYQEYKDIDSINS